MEIKKDKKSTLIYSIIGIIIFFISAVGFYFFKFYAGILIILPSVVLNTFNIWKCLRSSRSENTEDNKCDENKNGI